MWDVVVAVPGETISILAKYAGTHAMCGQEVSTYVHTYASCI